ncbi:MAG: UDP-N-acetylmuramoyl-tripeptide--D-alanyl-D-alanine ligase [Thermodesulfobacteriota bacterium]|nr:UDP-N-acetylmuramoyl-tripeptide--D-alanyl-D-alanine ligase [Thermodesulfobacteriota bacterium]
MKSPVLQMGEVIAATKGTLIRGNPEGVFEGLCTNSRKVIGGNLFIPLAGKRFDGHNFIEDAVNNGATGLFVQAGSEEIIERVASGVSVILVDDTLHALGDIANLWRNKFTNPVVAVTGSSGKTTTKEMIATVCGLSGDVLKSRGNYNNLVGLPLSLLDLSSRHKMAVVEMGSSMRGEIKRLATVAEPDIGVITNTGSAHLEGFGSVDAIMEEKGEIFFNMRDNGTAIINRDDEGSRILADRWMGRNISFGIDENAFVRAERIFMRGERGISFTLKIGETGKGIDMTVVGRHNIYNALACAAACFAMDIDYDLICEGLSAFRQIQGRMNIHTLKIGGIVIDDTYNANPDSTMEALKTLNDLKGKNESIVIVGDMLELGEKAEELHEEIGRAMADTGVGNIFLRGDFAGAVARGAIEKGFSEDHIYFAETPGRMMGTLHSLLREGDCILIKGSRDMKMENFLLAIIEEFGQREQA